MSQSAEKWAFNHNFFVVKMIEDIMLHFLQMFYCDKCDLGISN